MNKRNIYKVKSRKIFMEKTDEKSPLSTVKKSAILNGILDGIVTFDHRRLSPSGNERFEGRVDKNSVKYNQFDYMVGYGIGLVGTSFGLLLGVTKGIERIL